MSVQLIAGAGLVAGLLGSAHCVAMCGSIAGAFALGLSRVAPARRRVLLGAASLGRITAYALAGALAGGAGSVAASASGLVALREAAQVTTALALLLLGLRALGWQRATRWLDAAGARLWRYAAPLLRALLPLDRGWRAFAAGLLWGWLPCGMVYAALLLAAASLDPLHGAATMFAFGVGTLPGVWLAHGAFGNAAWRVAGSRGRPWLAAAMLVMAVVSLASALVPGHHHASAVTASHARHATHASHRP